MEDKVQLSREQYIQSEINYKQALYEAIFNAMVDSKMQKTESLWVNYDNNPYDEFCVYISLDENNNLVLNYLDNDGDLDGGDVIDCDLDIGIFEAIWDFIKPVSMETN